MKDVNPLSDPNSTPEDVATLYSWANLHGAKYRDFSAARAQTRESVRLRAEQAAEEQRQREQGEPEEKHPGGPSLVLPPQGEILSAESHAEHQPAAASEHFWEPSAPVILEGEHVNAYDPDSPAQETVHAATEEHSWPQEDAAEKSAAEAAERARLTALHAHEEAERAQEEARRASEYAAQLTNEQAAHRAAVQAAEKARAEAEENARIEAEKQAQAEAEQKTRLESEEKARIEAEENSRREAQEAQEREAHAAAERARQHEAQIAAQQAAATTAAEAVREAAAHEAEKAKPQPLWQSLQSGISTGSFATTAAAQSSSQRGREYAGYGQPEVQKASPDQPESKTRREENSMPTHTPWAEPEVPENGNGSRPAWLSDSDRSETPSQGSFQGASSAATATSLPGAPEDTLQGSRDRLTSRWFALRGIFEGTPAPVEPVPPPVLARPPATAVFSLAGGVGKTSLVATLGRALSARGERVLLVDTAAFGLLPFFYGAMDQRPGVLRTFNPPGLSSEAPIQMVTIDPEGIASETAGQESLSGEIGKFSRGVSRVIVDLATASGATTRRILRMSPLVLIPVIPDMNSVVSVSSIDAFFEHNSNPSGKPSMPFYVLNQFDSSLPLHLDVREVLREQLGDRLLPFALHRTPAMSEALAEGMTVIDYAPGSPLAEDFSTLAGWVKSLSAPATTTYRGVRWSER